MNYLNSRIIYSVLFYVLLMVLIFMARPSVMFENERLRPFGVGYDKTMFSFGVFSVVLAVLSFYLFCIIDLMFPK